VSYSQEEYVAKFGGIYEHSAWIAEASWLAANSATDQLSNPLSSLEEVATSMAAVVDAASEEKQLRLIRAHPDLAGRIALAGELTVDSTTEQASAGLDQCSETEFQKFLTLNQAYVEKFAFPFIMAVRNSNRHEILRSFEHRLNNTYAQEFITAIEQIHRIARLRLEQIL